MEFTALQRLYEACDPTVALGPDDPRNVDLDVVDASGECVRGDRWAELIARRIALGGAQPTMTLFTGLPGSGKTTELLRLQAQLRFGERRLLTVIVDAADTLSLSERVDLTDVLAALLHGSERAVLEAEGRDPEEALRDGAMRRLWNWLSRTDLEFTRIEWGYSADQMSGKLVSELKTRPVVREKVRQIVAQHLSAFVQQVHDEFRKLAERVQAIGEARWKGLVVVLDSLERVQAPAERWDEILRGTERLFSEQLGHLRLPVHVLYTVPPALFLRLRERVQFLPMIKLHDRHGRPNQRGIDATRRMIEARVPVPYLNELFGAPARAARVAALISASGGYPRELVRLLRVCIEQHDLLSRAGGFERILRREGDGYRRIVRGANAQAWLAGVHQKGVLTLEHERDREVALHMLSANVLLYYLNDEEWFDLHPAVLEMQEISDLLAVSGAPSTR